MTAEHTKGPWHVGREADHSCDRYAKNAEWARIRDEQGGLVAKVESVHPKGKRQSSDFDIEADRARLIAAAPDLLEACKDGIKFLNSLADTEASWENENRDAFRRILTKAIAEVEPWQ